MAPKAAKASHLRFSPELLVRLGEELVPHIDIGISELARNAYDADAKKVTIKLVDVVKPGGIITISDDGNGMTESEVLEGWLLLGRSSKRSERKSPGGRRYVGEKGLGRLAALRFGDVTVLRTRPKANPGTELELTIEWDRFTGVKSLDEVDLEIVHRTTRNKPGTDIELRSIRSPLTDRDVKRLARSLVLLADPFKRSAFRVDFVSDEFKEYSRLVREAYFDEADYRIIAKLDGKGRLSASMVDWKGRSLASGKHDEIAKGSHRSGGYMSPAFEFTLWVFNLHKQSFDVRNSQTTVSAVQTWLDAVGGVRLYHRGLRVAPYGDKGVDWLNLNLRRSQNPEQRPSTNNSLGQVVVNRDDADLLHAKTDRSGLIDNLAFDELRAACAAVLDWAALQRVRARDSTRRQRKTKTESSVEEATADLSSSLSDVPDVDRERVEEAAERLQEAVAAQVAVLEDELQLYRTMSTVGTTTAVFAHEIVQPVETVEAMAKSIESNGRKELGDRYDEALGRQVEVLAAASTSLKTYSQLPLRLLQKSKRKPGLVDVHRTIEQVIELMQPSLDAAKIVADFDFVDERLTIQSSVAALEAVIVNLMVNARYVLAEQSAAMDRRILVRTRRVEGTLCLLVMDNGPGIADDVDATDVWLPGVTARPGGTGLGLTIVRDVVDGLNGDVLALARGELGGAEFRVSIPLDSWPMN